MDEKTLFKLEWPLLIEQLATFAGSFVGKAYCRTLPLDGTEGDIRLRQRLTSECGKLIDADGALPLGGLRDISNSLERARVGTVLEVVDLVEIASTLRVGRSVKRFLMTKIETYPELWQVAQPIILLEDLERDIQDSFSPDGGVLDTASHDLMKIREQIRTAQNRIREKLMRLIQSPSYRNILQESLMTQRHGRYVIPVRTEAQSQIPGLVHDQSASGATVYLEPMAVVDLNNQLRKHQSEEEAEIRRIMERFSRRIASEADHLALSLAQLAHLDAISAMAQYSISIGGSEPRLNTQGRVDLEQVRHPLLIRQLGRDQVVPTDIQLGKQFNTLIITGPNTGGKTVALKTVGLCALMTRAGLHLPTRDRAEMAIFDDILADIGDEQSVVQNLSTFSGHIRRVIEILTQAHDEHSLVLIDEIVTGTDPTEGAALGRAIIETLHTRGVRSIITTHYGELKNLAFAKEGVAWQSTEGGSAIWNASVEFDLQSLAPTYRLLLGVPGRSNATAIALRLGLDPTVVHRAEDLLGQESREVAQTLQGLEDTRRQLNETLEQARQQEAESRRLKEQYEAKLKATEEKYAELRARRDNQIEGDVQKAQAEIAEIIRNLQFAGTAQGAEAARQQLSGVKRRYVKPTVEKPKPVKVWKAGDTALIGSIKQKGKLISDPDSSGSVQIAVGNLKMTVKVADLLLPDGTQAQVAKPVTASKPHFQVSPPANPSLRGNLNECDLRGLLRDEAIPKVEYFLDDAYRSNLNRLYLIHGKGTGALRQAVHDYLKTSPYSPKFRLGDLSEGGAGVTVVEF